MKDYKIELLAPAGNVEAFKGAIHAGADAVYLGGARFGARAYADNFTTEELIDCIRYAHLFGRRVYLTVNTLFKDRELDDLYDYLLPFYEAGLDAVIVQDLGVFQYVKCIFPDLEIHVSTQMTITGEYGAAMLKEMGASRIVPARELSLKEIKTIKEKTGLEMETFIHGAMCYCYSGQCLFSSILGGRSGNRGRCAQPCRLPYSVDVGDSHLDECYPLSLKDMCTLEHIGEFMDAGIDSFKIEGRMKKPEYSAGATAIYRKYIDKKIKNPQKPLQIDPKDQKALTSIYIRSKRQNGYYYKQNGADMVTLDNPAYSGSDEELLAQIRQKYIETSLKKPISIYASFYCDSQVSVTYVYEDISVTVTGDIMEPAKNQPITEETIRKQLCKLGDTCFEPESVEIYTDNQGFYSLKAINELRRQAVQELEDRIIQGYGLVSGRVTGIMHDKLVEKVEGRSIESVVVSSGGELSADIVSKNKKNPPISSGWSVLVSSKQQYDALHKYLSCQNNLKVSRIYVESELFFQYPELPLSLEQGEIFGIAKNSDNVETSVQKRNFEHVEICIALPYIMRKKDEARIQQLLTFAHKVNGFLIRNLEEYGYLKTCGYKGKCIADAGVYIWNKEAYEFWQDKVDMVTCPFELNNREWQTLFHKRPVEKVIYGRLPMMITANCVAKTSGKCLHAESSLVAALTDRYHKQFPVIVQCPYCMNIILNSVPLSLHNKECLGWYQNAAKRLVFTIESGQETAEILDFYEKLSQGVASQPPFTEYTTGHEKRGVE